MKIDITQYYRKTCFQTLKISKFKTKSQKVHDLTSNGPFFEATQVVIVEKRFLTLKYTNNLRLPNAMFKMWQYTKHSPFPM